MSYSSFVSSPPPMTERHQPHRRERASLRGFTIRLPRPILVEIVRYYKFQLRSAFEPALDSNCLQTESKSEVPARQGKVEFI